MSSKKPFFSLPFSLHPLQWHSNKVRERGGFVSYASLVYIPISLCFPGLETGIHEVRLLDANWFSQLNLNNNVAAGGSPAVCPEPFPAFSMWRGPSSGDGSSQILQTPVEQQLPECWEAGPAEVAASWSWLWSLDCSYNNVFCNRRIFHCSILIRFIPDCNS